MEALIMRIQLLACWSMPAALGKSPCCLLLLCKVHVLVAAGFANVVVQVVVLVTHIITDFDGDLLCFLTAVDFQLLNCAAAHAAVSIAAGTSVQVLAIPRQPRQP